MSRTLTAVLIGAATFVSLAPSVQAQQLGAPFTPGLGSLLDYRFRTPSANGYVQLNFDDFFFNAHAWHVDFEDDLAQDASVEIDFTAGYNFRLSEDTAGAVRATYYWFPDANTPPGAADFNFFELGGALSHRFLDRVTVLGEFAWSPNFFLESGSALWLKGGVAVPLIDQFIVDPLTLGPLTASANVGHQWIEDSTTFPDYTAWDAGLSLGLEAVTVDLRWYQNDLDVTQCIAPLATEFCEGGLFATLSVAIPGFPVAFTLPPARLID